MSNYQRHDDRDQLTVKKQTYTCVFRVTLHFTTQGRGYVIMANLVL